MGIGDDCAILPAGDDFDLVFTTDMLVEDIHFLRDKISPLDLGHKSLAVNLSDVAAMGAEPVGSFLSIAIPNTIDVEYLDSLMEGYHQLSEKYKLPLMGGDTTRSPYKLVLNISVVGKIAKGRAKLRKAAMVGDVVAVTGSLGDSAAGLHALMNDFKIDETVKWLIDRHHRPEAHVSEGIWLGNRPEVHAMMDVSDGIASDLMHILRASGKSATIKMEQLPLSGQLLRMTESHHLNSYELATSGGEDYCLLLTVAADTFEQTAGNFQQSFGRPLHAIGRIEAGEPSIQWTLNGTATDNPKGGFNHFSG